MKPYQVLALLMAIVTTAVYCSNPQTKTETINETDTVKVVYLNQGWSAEDRAEYYWAPQGSALLSYDIYLALKDPETKALINSPAMTNQFGFLREPAGHPKNPDELPVGIAKSEVKDGPFKGVYAGLTCAACHSNQINYNGTNIRIDGGNASALQLVPWLKKLSGALDHVQKDESAFKEMVAEIGKKAKVDEADLRKRLNEDVDIAKSWINKILFSKQENGPGRVDAFGGIANAFLGIHTGIFDNITIDRAPVKPPFVWNSSQSAWVEWSGVSPNPLTRNYSEALGVFARYDLTSKGNPANYNISTVDVRWLAQIEQMLRRLAPPQWPQEVLGKIDEAKAARGAKLFTTNCASCHSTYPHRWSEPREQGKRMIENALVPQGYVGTDPANLKSIALDTNAVVETKHLKSIFGGKEKVTPTQFFQVVEGAMMGYSLKKAGFTPEETLDAYGYQSLERLAAAKIPFGRYKAAPRDGSWAIGPFLHNASVPNLYELLSPAKERSQTFYVNSQFDPLKVGISTAATSGVFLFNTKLEGNSNAGHSFENVKGPGVIGRLFTEAERYEIIEFLKSIPTQPGQITPYGGPANPVLAKDDKTWFNNKIPY